MIKKPMKSTLLLTACLSLLMASSAFAADGKELYNTKGCAGCHGADAKTPVAPLYPKIAGQSKEYIEQQIKDIKSGARSNGQSAAMKAVLVSVTDDEITALADYLSGL